ncbi:uncharacterized protein LOC101856790 [Aplysia californica]|uniref:Uncharacterized protein LOC101856790 n=1 Tax=Aplysia californica TaxID=6500 RepID=A0ABM0JHR2_APLCA|nr:uncharacterized protein LOC101856790 [Aplysia californica]
MMSLSEEESQSVHENNFESDTETEERNKDVKASQESSCEDHVQTLGISDQSAASKQAKKSEKAPKPKVKIKTLTIDGQLVYFCKICDKIFTRRKDKLNHELAHSGESVLTCTECGKEYLHESSLASHMRTHSADQLHMCELCPKMFAQSHHLKTHILSHSEPNDFTCKTCYVEFATAVELNHHIRTEIKLEISYYWCKMCKVYCCRNHGLQCDKNLHAYQCSACNELFFTNKKLRIHMKKFAHHSVQKPKFIEPLKEHELYRGKCVDGNKKSSVQGDKENVTRKQIVYGNSNLNKRFASDDLENELPPKRFKLSPRKLCVEVDNSSTSMQESAPEMKIEFKSEIRSPVKQRKGKPYCKRCNKSFKDTHDLDRHKVQIHEEKQSAASCEICGMEFASKDELAKHSTKHSGERMHACPMCGKEFLHLIHLTKHLRSHTGDFPYKCSTCKKAFRLKIQLIQHVRLHVAQDTNACDKCTAKFTSKQELQEHMVQAHGEPDCFKCHLCSKTFSFRYKLINHLRLHTNVKCFQCYICHKSFATKHYLQRHLQIHIKQGMEVDVKNIIVDQDSKTELDHSHDQQERCVGDTWSTAEGQRVLEKHCAGVKRGEEVLPKSQPENSDSKCISENFESRSTFVSESASNSRNYDLNCTHIKTEPVDRDSSSEHSVCSSLTRHSDKSDPFRFSSDGSTSFKTTMAKERIRIRRRWKKMHLARKAKALQNVEKAALELKKETVFSEVKIEDENENGDEAADYPPTDMVVELNGVCSEVDNVLTLYVDVTEKKPPLLPMKQDASVIAALESPEKVSASNKLNDDVAFSNALVLDIDISDSDLDALKCGYKSFSSLDKSISVSVASSNTTSTSELQGKSVDSSKSEATPSQFLSESLPQDTLCFPTDLGKKEVNAVREKTHSNRKNEKPQVPSVVVPTVAGTLKSGAASKDNYSSQAKTGKTGHDVEVSCIPASAQKMVSRSATSSKLLSPGKTSLPLPSSSKSVSGSAQSNPERSGIIYPATPAPTPLSQMQAMICMNLGNIQHSTKSLTSSRQSVVTTAADTASKTLQLVPSSSVSLASHLLTPPVSSGLQVPRTPALSTPSASSVLSNFHSPHKLSVSSCTSMVRGQHATQFTTCPLSIAPKTFNFSAHSSMAPLTSQFSTHECSVAPQFTSQSAPLAPVVQQLSGPPSLPPLLPGPPAAPHTQHQTVPTPASSYIPTSSLSSLHIPVPSSHSSGSAFHGVGIAPSHSFSVPMQTLPPAPIFTSLGSSNMDSLGGVTLNPPQLLSGPGPSLAGVPSSLGPPSGLPSLQQAASGNVDSNPFTLAPPATIDTNNPVLRNMNMMDLVSPSGGSNSFNVAVPGPTPDLMRSSFNTLRQGPAGILEPQSSVLQPGHLLNVSSRNLGGVNIGSQGLSSFSSASNIHQLPGAFNPVPGGYMHNSLLSTGQGMSGDPLSNARNMPNILPDPSLNFLNSVQNASLGFPVAHPVGPTANSAFPFGQLGAATFAPTPAPAPTINFGGLTIPSVDTRMPSINSGILDPSVFSMGASRHPLPGPPTLGMLDVQRFAAPGLHFDVPRVVDTNFVASQLGLAGAVNPTFLPTNMTNFPNI